MIRIPKSILIVRLSAIGDVIHALPVLETIRSQAPGVRIGWLVEELSAPLLENHPDIDRLYIIPKKRWRGSFRKMFLPEIRPFFQRIRHDEWEASLDLQGLSKSAAAAYFSGAKIRVGFRGENAREVSPYLNNRIIQPKSQDRHVVRQNLRLLSGLGLRPPKEAPRGRLGISEEERDAMRDKLSAAGWRGEPLLAINPGAGWETKRYPPKDYARLAMHISLRKGLRPLVLWGPKEESMRDEIVGALRPAGAITAPPTSVRELAVLISIASFFVGGDTGATHMAGLLAVPVLSIFGGSEPDRNRPWPVRSGPAVQRRELECINCWKTVCPLGGAANLQCLKEFPPEKILEQAGPWLDRLDFPRT